MNSFQCDSFRDILLLHSPANDQSTKGILQTSILFPPEPCERSNHLLQPHGYVSSMQITTSIQWGSSWGCNYPSEVRIASVEMTITDRSASLGQGIPAPTWDSVSDYPVPFVVRRAGGSMLASGRSKPRPSPTKPLNTSERP